MGTLEIRSTHSYTLSGSLIFDGGANQDALLRFAALDSLNRSSIRSAIFLNDPLTLNVEAPERSNILGSIQESGGPKSLSKTGPGAAFLSGFIESENTYTGVTTALDGALELIKINSQPTNAIRGPLVIGDGIGADRVLIHNEWGSAQISPTSPITVTSSGVLEIIGPPTPSQQTLGPLTLERGAIVHTRSAPT